MCLLRRMAFTCFCSPPRQIPPSSETFIALHATAHDPALDLLKLSSACRFKDLKELEGKVKKIIALAVLQTGDASSVEAPEEVERPPPKELLKSLE